MAEVGGGVAGAASGPYALFDALGVERPYVIDAGAGRGEVITQILRAGALPAERFRTILIKGRPLPRPGTPRVAAFEYWRFGIGGADRTVQLLMGVFIRMGMRVILYTETPPQADDLELPVGVTRKVVPEGREERVAFWLDEVEKEGIDVVVYNTWIWQHAPIDCLAMQVVGATVIYHTHGSTSYFINADNGAELLDRICKMAYRADCSVALSEADCTFLSAFSGCVRQVVNPVIEYLRDVRARVEPPEGRTVVFCGRLDPHEKRPEVALRVFARVHEVLSDARLLVVGGGAPEVERSLRDQARRDGIGNAVSFLGYRRHPLPYLMQANALLMTSPSEGFPLVLAEAMCVGLPAVLFALPQVALLNNAGGGAVQVPQGDVEAAADSLVALLSDRDVQRRLSRAARVAFESTCDVDLDGLWASVLEDARSSHLGAPRTFPAPAAGGPSAFVSCVVNAYRDQDRRVRQLENELSGVTDELSAQRDELGRVRAEAEGLRHDLSCVKGSASFRIGRTITRLPRYLRDLLRRSRA